MNFALYGEAGSGKDFVAEMLDNQYGCTRYAFADEVKYLAELFFSYRYSKNKKDRDLLQKIGTKMREIDPDVWIKNTFQSIDEIAYRDKSFGYAKENIVITDCRLPNEYEMLKRRGYIFIRITADEEIRKQRMIERGDVFTSDNMKHPTESHYDEFECDYEIINNGTADNVRNQLDVIIDSLAKSRRYELYE